MRTAPVIKSSYRRTLYAIPILIGAFGAWSSVQLMLLPRELLPFDNPGKERTLDELEILKDIVGLVGFAFFILVWWLRWRAAVRHNQQRQAAARGEGNAKPIDLTRFAHGDSRLALPVTLKQHLAWRSGLLWIIFGVVFGIIELCFGCAFLAVRGDPQAATPALLLAVQGILVGMLVGILLLMALAARQRIDVTEEGLRVRRSGFGRRIRWTDARLFALVGVNSVELAGARGIVRFSRLESADLVKPTIPFSEYTRQMDLLVSLVNERTGLPLYDLREKK
jgi:membrane protein implicated in regulation of membrane protease activity